MCGTYYHTRKYNFLQVFFQNFYLLQIFNVLFLCIIPKMTANSHKKKGECCRKWGTAGERLLHDFYYTTHFRRLSTLFRDVFRSYAFCRREGVSCKRRNQRKEVLAELIRSRRRNALRKKSSLCIREVWGSVRGNRQWCNPDSRSFLFPDCTCTGSQSIWYSDFFSFP